MDSELAFRAQLVIQDHCRLYDYWREQAGSSLAPSRKDIDPAAIPNLLPHVCLIDIENGMDDAVFRLAGTRIRDIYGFEITGTSLSEMDWGTRTVYWDAIYRNIVDKCAPMQGVVTGPVAQREHVTAFWLRLPLSDDGRRVNKILCHDIPTANNDLLTSATTVNRVA